MKSSVLLSVGLLVAGSLFAAAAQADADAIPTVAVITASKKVPAGDLNLASPRGIEVLYGRIERAARKVCGPATNPGSRIISSDYLACVEHAVGQAVARVDRPALSDYHAERAQKFPVATSAALNR